MAEYILSIDQGTTGSTVVIINKQGRQVAKSSKEYPQIFPKPGWVEHNPEDIWESVVACVAESLQKAQINGKQIAAIGITNQRETVVLWDRRTQKAMHNAIVWQCRRTQDFCAQLTKSKKDKFIQSRTGLVIDPYFSGTKIRWLLKNVPGLKEPLKKGELAAGTIDTFLLSRLTAGHTFKTDVSNASRTQLMNIKSTQWDTEMLKLLGVPLSILPEICDSSGLFGHTRGLDVLPDGIPITGIAGDQQAALFGQTAFKAGEAKCTFGTGSFLLLNTGEKPVFSRHRMLTTVAWRLSGAKTQYALEGGAFICGAAVQWLRDGLQMIRSSSEIEPLAREVENTGGVVFVPALTGLGAPHWQADARGTFTGLTRGTTRSHIARATLEAMALQNVDILTAMQKDLGQKLKALKVDGGATVNKLLMQMQADFLGVPLVRPTFIETTAIGAAYLAGLGAKFWSNQAEIKKVWHLDQEFRPQISAGVRNAKLEEWQRAVDQLIH
jgi:glycerol kinase